MIKQNSNRAKIGFLAIIALSVVSGCSLLSYDYVPNIEVKPNILAKVPIDKIAQPSMPEEETQSFDIRYRTETPLPKKKKDYTGNIIKNAEKRKPSVLIGLPVDDKDTGITRSIAQLKSLKDKGQINYSQYEKSLNELLTQDQNNSDKQYNLFATKGYYNTKEQIIEKALIFAGFDVRDRAKFEAILRDLRDKNNQNKRRWHSQDEDLTPEAKTKLSLLTDQLTNNLISQSEFDKKTSLIREDAISYRSSPGVSRGENDNEMIDTSEMIRAANGRADYLLLVNEFKINQVKDGVVDLMSNSAFYERREELKKQIPLEKLHKLPTKLLTPGYGATFTAKLINVKTGSIEWIGSYFVSSSNILDFQVEFSYEKIIANKSELLGRVTQFNTELDAKKQALEIAERQYISAANRANKKETFEQEYALNNHKTSVANNYQYAEVSYQNALKAYKAMSDERTQVLSNLDWTFDYNFAQPVIRPDITQLNNKENSGEFEAHIKRLLEEVIDKLLSTIEVEDYS